MHSVLRKHILQDRSFSKGSEICLGCYKSIFSVKVFLTVNIQMLFHNVTTTRKSSRLNDFLNVLVICNVVIPVKGTVWWLELYFIPTSIYLLCLSVPFRNQGQ